MKQLWNSFMKEEEGSIVEYIIVLAVVAIVVVALMPGLRGKVIDWFNSLIGNVDEGIGAGGGADGEVCYMHDGTEGTFTNGVCS